MALLQNLHAHLQIILNKTCTRMVLVRQLPGMMNIVLEGEDDLKEL